MSSESPAGLFARLKAAHQVNAPPVHLPDGADVAGEEAETRVFQTAKEARSIRGAKSIAAWTSALTSSGKNELVFKSVRVPATAAQGAAPNSYRGRSGPHREIDVVCISSSRILLLEVKNWSGHLEASNGGGEAGLRWAQRKRSGEVLSHACPVQLLRSKGESLRCHLDACLGEPLPSSFPIQTLVVFTNPNASFGAEVAALPGVVTPDCWEEAVQAYEEGSLLGWLAGAAAAAAAAPLPRWVRALAARRGAEAPAAARLSRAQLAAVSAALGEARGWDRLLLHGGRDLKGDWRGFRCRLRLQGEQARAWEGLLRAADRAVAASCTFEHYRGALWGSVGYLKALGGTAPPVKVKVHARPPRTEGPAARGASAARPGDPVRASTAAAAGPGPALRANGPLQLLPKLIGLTPPLGVFDVPAVAADCVVCFHCVGSAQTSEFSMNEVDALILSH